MSFNTNSTNDIAIGGESPTRFLRGICIGFVALWMLSLIASPAQSQIFRAAAVQQNWFESWALQGRNEQYFRQQLESQAQLQIDSLKTVVTISEDQEAKLRLALEGDLARFFRMVDEARFKTRNMQPVNEQVGEISRIISPLQQLVQQGILNDDSLFSGMMGNILNDEQETLWKAEQARRQRLIHKAIIQVQLCTLERTMPLLAKQREALITAVLDRLEGKNVTDQYRVYLVDYAMYTMPDTRLKEFLDDRQVEFYKEKRSQVEGWKSMLESQGAKFEDEPQPAEEAREDEPENADAVEAEDKDVKKKPARAVAGGLG
jgi:hypothetical protein